MTEEEQQEQEENSTVSETEDAQTESAEAKTPEEGLFAELEKAQADAMAARDGYLRTVADMENLRKRFAREKEEIRRRAASDLIEDLLPALDNLEIGLASAANHPEASDVAKGFEFVATQIGQILQQHGLERVSPAPGEPFDHSLHEAVAHEASDEIEDHQVIKVMRVGYSLNERLLRPASVVVSSGAEK
ncbi:nucleotide exchange factor GrpE [Rubellicoccus peritrichatus]|uniref:Protein GrpE n=1 Tax=Rubellicoccus peritrichatus TaxID=3080537 RepID=A0AAQ3LDA5_9BACT|nr:nucleotide exchange factor GrpE [Puniceicoccus sp. CR14]WOO41458.1 nucleotide exchange factor GrpE [Puniceicoccus sp. CR14]